MASLRHRSNVWLSGAGERAKWGWLLMGMEFLLEVIEMFLN
jgi:hypothetical protein